MTILSILLDMRAGEACCLGGCPYVGGDWFGGSVTLSVRTSLVITLAGLLATGLFSDSLWSQPFPGVVQDPQASDPHWQAWQQSWVARLHEAATTKETENPGNSNGSISQPDQSSATNQQGDPATSKADPCGCDSCNVALPAAPCLECPHVSTLNPHYNLQLFGTMKLDMLYNEARPVSAGIPFFLAPDSAFGLSQNTVDIHARQTSLGAALAGPKIGDFQAGGLFIGMLFNDNLIADRYGFLPLQAYGELKNDDWRFAAGLQFDVFAPGLPMVLPFSALAASGNAGNSFRGSVRLERYWKPTDDLQWTLQGALSEPITTTVDPVFAINEDNGWPDVEGRVALGLGQPESVGATSLRPIELGLSGVIGQIRNTRITGERAIADVWGFSVDYRWKVSRTMGITGEVHGGETLGTYNAAILQTVNLDTLQGIYSTGGWFELFHYWTPRLHSHSGYGIDDPRDRDVADSVGALGRTFNSTIYNTLFWDVNQSLRIGFEVSWRETDYKNPLNLDNEGIGFHSQIQWVF